MSMTAWDHLTQAIIHDRAGRETEAVPYYKQALHLGLDSEHERIALIYLASSYRNIEEYSHAQETIEQARQKFPNDLVVEAFAALILLDAGHAGQAVRTLGLAMCHQAPPEALDGFTDVLIGKFQELPG